MAKRDILKEAIADAKTVKETAIANAKAALEEAFTPRLKEMLATKLEEMDLDEEEEMKKEEMSNPDMRKKKEYAPEKATRDRDMMEEMDDKKMDEEMKDMDEEINLDEILAEIELDEEYKDKIKEDEATDKEEEGYIDGEEDADEDKDEEEIDLEDMSDDDLKGFIEDVIADMVASGDLEAGENFEEEDEDEMEMVDDEEIVDVEISEEMKKDKKDKRKVDELAGMPTSNVARGGNKYDDMSSAELAKTAGEGLMKSLAQAGVDLKALGSRGLDALKKWSDDFEKNKKYASSGNKAATRPGNSGIGLGEEMGEELEEAYSFIKTLKSDLYEVNLLNAKLLYTNKIFKAKTLTESQKVKVLSAFDKAGTVKETKLVFETLNEGLKTKKTSMIKESLGSASRVSKNTNTKKPIIETNPMVARFQKLAGLK